MKSRRMKHEGVLHTALSCDDILCNILIRLPPKSITKFVIVSKRWLHLICSSSFRHSYLSRWRVGFNLLGFFVCNSLYLGRPKGGARRPRSEPALPLLSSSREGDDLKFSGVLKKLGYFIDSSDGLLLCGRHPKTYFVWNPITKQQYKLPHPRVHFEELCMAFIVEDSPDDEICYRVVRAKCESRFEEVYVVTIETFLSKISTWCYSKLRCSSTISLSPWTSGTVIGGVIHWYAAQGNIAIYDPYHHEKHIALVKLPGPFDFDEQVLGESSDGCLQYGWSCKAGLQIWVLEKGFDGYSSLFSTNEQTILSWSLRYKLNFKIMWRKNPTLATKCVTRKETEILAFSPQDSKSVFIRSGSSIYLYHIGSGRMEVIQYQGRGSSILSDFSKVVPYFKRAWPQSTLCCGGNSST
ncbi:hypothetical protein Godav_012506 [Gossypium davidsonii]|uniref:F-box domain-containing protein n=2 Tax=Gossypium TaxID=3633 RepID=A0A7J8RDI3_GOSDV|nr:hypothetical protein [Gossypium davidsonii]MBA0646981.1 hypothetical protein [Gossypium klotzschianum]